MLFETLLWSIKKNKTSYKKQINEARWDIRKSFHHVKHFLKWTNLSIQHYDMPHMIIVLIWSLEKLQLALELVHSKESRGIYFLTCLAPVIWTELPLTLFSIKTMHTAFQNTDYSSAIKLSIKNIYTNIYILYVWWGVWLSFCPRSFFWVEMFTIHWNIQNCFCMLTL